MLSETEVRNQRTRIKNLVTLSLKAHYSRKANGWTKLTRLPVAIGVVGFFSYPQAGIIAAFGITAAVCLITTILINLKAGRQSTDQADLMMQGIPEEVPAYFYRLLSFAI